MSIEWFVPRARLTTMRDLARISNEYLKFSAEVWENYFKKAPYLGIGYSDCENAIYIKPSQKSGLKVGSVKSSSVKLIRITPFMERFKLFFDKPCDVKIETDNSGSNSFKLLLKCCVKEPS